MEGIKARVFIDNERPLAEDIKKYIWLNEKGFVTDKDLLLIVGAMVFKHTRNLVNVENVAQRENDIIVDYISPVTLRRDDK